MASTGLPQLPPSQKAVIQSEKTPGAFEVSENRPVPVPKANELIVKVSAVSLNHCDWKMPGRVPCPGAVDGADYSGTIVRMGEIAALKSGFQIGDRVAGAQMASSRRRPWAGAFTEYLRDEYDMVWKVPDNLSWEQAAAIGCATTSTVGMALWISMKLPGTPENPIKEPKLVLVYGGSTASGTFAIQLLKLSGYKVVTTCSPKNFKLVEEYGADKAFDYHSATCGEDIRAYTNNTLEYALDIITEARTIRHCYAAIGRGGGRYCGFELLPEDLIATMRKSVKAEWVMGLEMTGLEIDLPGGYYRKANPELHTWFCDWKERYVALFGSGKTKTHPITVRQGGLEKVIDGIESMRRREVSGEKIVYPLYIKGC
uniref:Trans-enoyl reductase xenG n=1 Tax=Xenoacremonium sinensis TaxID=2480843 RepID=XENG_XENSI|nr:RecName: Full=Trans-enoyl reductase xenG; AltName: Full=Xenoacremones biosynthesis cluster protein G [Xenoacremonium sp. BF-2018a]QOJ72665.1 XenG [Xenoacremonium sp. BF-2018a]